MMTTIQDILNEDDIFRFSGQVKLNLGTEATFEMSKKLAQSFAHQPCSTVWGRHMQHGVKYKSEV